MQIFAKWIVFQEQSWVILVMFYMSGYNNVTFIFVDPCDIDLIYVWCSVFGGRNLYIEVKAIFFSPLPKKM
jgi:hypothetical protein